MPERYNRVLECKKTIFWTRYRMSLFTFLFLGELGPLYTRGKKP
jgi:hypothetical protein